MNINILLIVVGIILAFNVIMGYKEGMTHQLVTLVSTIIGGIVVVLISVGLRNYVSGHLLNVLLVLVLLAALAIIQVAVKAFFFSLKIISKFPILHGLDRVVGIFFGAVETLILVWFLYTILMMFDLGLVGDLIKRYTRESEILTWLFEKNYVRFLLDRYLPENWTDWFSILKG